MLRRPGGSVLAGVGQEVAEGIEAGQRLAVEFDALDGDGAPGRGAPGKHEAEGSAFAGHQVPEFARGGEQRTRAQKIAEREAVAVSIGAVDMDKQRVGSGLHGVNERREMESFPARGGRGAVLCGPEGDGGEARGEREDIVEIVEARMGDFAADVEAPAPAVGDGEGGRCGAGADCAGDRRRRGEAGGEAEKSAASEHGNSGLGACASTERLRTRCGGERGGSRPWMREKLLGNGAGGSAECRRSATGACAPVREDSWVTCEARRARWRGQPRARRIGSRTPFRGGRCG
jgi:hypothetical protein